MSARVQDFSPVNPPPTRPTRMTGTFDVPLNELGEKFTITHPVPLTDADVRRLLRYFAAVSP